MQGRWRVKGTKIDSTWDIIHVHVCVQVLLHHGHVESVLSDKNPLLGVIIYDSCRDDPKEYIKEGSTPVFSPHI